MPNVSLLVILDGFGHSLETEHNAIALANTPTWDRSIAQRPHTDLRIRLRCRTTAGTNG